MQRNRRTFRQAGFSLIEMIVASFMLLLVVVGLVPLFVQSIKSNESADETSDRGVAEPEQQPVLPL